MELVIKMKLLPKLGPIVILLVVINGNACFAETPKQIMSWLPDPNKCLDLLELEKVEVNPQRQTISGDSRLVEDYRVVASWLEGFFTAWNLKSASGVDVKDATSYQMMTWMFSYCRTHPSKTLLDAAYEFINATKN
jgi:hypothetical protein